MKRLAFDVSAHLKRAQFVGVDKEQGTRVQWEGEEIIVNSAQFGYDIAMDRMLGVMRQYNLQPRDCLLVFEGLNSKGQRLMVDKRYKSKRGDHHPKQLEEFMKLRSMIEQAWMGVGATGLWQDWAEADDTIAYLAQETESDLVISTTDYDLSKLMTEDGQTNKYGAKITVNVAGEENICKINGKVFVYPLQYFTLCKSLLGDKSDSIPGCTGFGPAAFDALVQKYEYSGLDDLISCLENGSCDPLVPLRDDAKSHKEIIKVMDQWDDVLKSWRVAKLRPEWVNTMSTPLVIKPGMVIEGYSDDRLKDYAGVTAGVTASNYDEMLAFFKEQVKVTPEFSFDLETSTPEESDDWLASQKDGKGVDAVDQLSSKLTGFSITFGPNCQYTIYVSVDHWDTDNVPMSKARELIEVMLDSGYDIAIHNTFFEFTVLYNAEDEDGTQWAVLWQKYGCKGFMPNAVDTKLEASYANENERLGLKARSKLHLGYEQQTYEKTTQRTLTDLELVKFDRPYKIVHQDHFQIIGEGESQIREEITQKKYMKLREKEASVLDRITTIELKMNALTLDEVVGYGCDDTITTIALHNYFRLVMELEHTWATYMGVELPSAYANASNYLVGFGFSHERMREIEADDDKIFDKAWGPLSKFLVERGWAGTIAPTFDREMDAAMIKDAYAIVAGLDREEQADLPDAEKDKFLANRARTPSKLFAAIEEDGVLKEPGTFVAAAKAYIKGERATFAKYVLSHFQGSPKFNPNSPIQMKKIMYELLELPIRLRNDVTDQARKLGITEGSPTTDELAIRTAIKFDAVDDAEWKKEPLEALLKIKEVSTRRKLFYTPYKTVTHWMDGRLHPSTNQCATVTRRNSASFPNYTQWPSTGDGLKFRETIVPIAQKRVLISADSSGQELRLGADLSKDENMISCFVGAKPRDIHSIVAAAATKFLPIDPENVNSPHNRVWSYDEFNKMRKDKTDMALYALLDDFRTKAKPVNFGDAYGAMAPSIAKQLMCTEEEAQAFLDAKTAEFSRFADWKKEEAEKARDCGYAITMLGARRHLREVYMTGTNYEKSSADRQAVNHEIQGGCAEAIKLAQGELFFGSVLDENDAYINGTIHDEIVCDAPEDAEKAYAVAKEMQRVMRLPYATMVVPFDSEVTIGVNFGDQVKLPGNFTVEDVAKAIAESKAAAAAKRAVAKVAREEAVA